MRAIIAAAAIALALGACAKDKKWVKEGASPNTLRSDLYWCSRVKVEKFKEFNPKTPDRRTERHVDAECMRKRGYRYE